MCLHERFFIVLIFCDCFDRVFKRIIYSPASFGRYLDSFSIFWGLLSAIN